MTNQLQETTKKGSNIKCKVPPVERPIAAKGRLQPQAQISLYNLTLARTLEKRKYGKCFTPLSQEGVLEAIQENLVDMVAYTCEAPTDRCSVFKQIHELGPSQGAVHAPVKKCRVGQK